MFDEIRLGLIVEELILRGIILYLSISISPFLVFLTLIYLLLAGGLLLYLFFIVLIVYFQNIKVKIFYLSIFLITFNDFLALSK
jgi:hypothetical protein